MSEASQIEEAEKESENISGGAGISQRQDIRYVLELEGAQELGKAIGGDMSSFAKARERG